MKFVKRAAFVAVFIAAMVVWFLAMTGLQWAVLFPLFGMIWAEWWAYVISFAGFFWFTLGCLERWASWTAKGTL